VSITTRCNMACRSCARTFERPAPRDMAPADFVRLLALLPHALRVVLVGLGEPLLHPRVVELVRHAAEMGRRVSLVTSGMDLDRQTGRALIGAGLASLTVSIDAVSPEAVARARRGSDLKRILGNLTAFAEESSRLASGRSVGVSVFTALAADTAAELDGIVEAVAPLGVDALMVSDLNFPENEERSLHRGLSPEAERGLDRTLRASLTRGLPVLSIEALEELDVPRRFREFLLLRGARLAARSRRHLRCRSPWQTLPVDPGGQVTFCDCQPGVTLGNVLREPFSAIWDGEKMRRMRRAMRSASPPAACLACPRF
jgi:radical SAM protein with 4Fe4S-binding SPASM domain